MFEILYAVVASDCKKVAFSVVQLGAQMVTSGPAFTHGQVVDCANIPVAKNEKTIASADNFFITWGSFLRAMCEG
jgi:hypothetical protein